MTTPTPAELAAIRERHAADAKAYASMPGLSSRMTRQFMSDRAALLAALDAATKTQGNGPPGAVIRALAALLKASYAEGLEDWQADLWREMAADGRSEYDRLRAALDAAEADRLLLAEGYIAVDESETRYVHWDTLQLAKRIVASAEAEHGSGAGGGGDG